MKHFFTADYECENTNFASIDSSQQLPAFIGMQTHDWCIFRNYFITALLINESFQAIEIDFRKNPH